MPKAKTTNIDTLTSLVQSYHPGADIALIRKAYQFGEKYHSGQVRSSGEPYIIHPLEVSILIAELRLDVQSIVTGLLHDTVEDTDATLEDITREFGKEVAELVDGVTKISKITFKTSKERQAENFRKMIIAMAKDIRVILVKLADRLNNMRTLQYLPPYKQKQISQETLDIYAPLANRLGISSIKLELEDICLRYLHPDVYYKLAQKVSKTKKERDKYIDEVSEILREKLEEYDLSGQVLGRAKHFFSIFKKMERRSVDYDQVYDIIAFRILVDNITECYKALGVVHAMYKPIPGRFKDYIAMPKANSYQSLHTTVIGPFGERVEMQIRTNEMNHVAERGIAAHWQYKEGKSKGSAPGNIEWVNRLLEWQKDLTDPDEFLETVKIDLFAADVFVFTPNGEVKQLPHGATPLDFAYSVHTDVGHRCIGAKVNGKIVPLKHRLKSGDTIEVLTSSTQSPSKDWLKIVRSSRAKAKIRVFIKQQERDRSLDLGKELLDKELRPFGLNLVKLERQNRLQKVAETLNCKSSNELLAHIGYGRTFSEEVIRELVPKAEYDKYVKENTETEEDESFLKKVFRVARKKSDAKNAITVANLDDVLIRFAKCCNALPGDSIMGFITRGRGVTIHTSNCNKALDTDPERRVDVRWNIHNKDSIRRHVKVRILSHDEPGLLAIMSQTIASCGVNITSAAARTTKDRKGICLFDLEVTGLEQLSTVLGALESKKGVISVERTRS